MARGRGSWARFGGGAAGGRGGGRREGRSGGRISLRLIVRLFDFRSDSLLFQKVRKEFDNKFESEFDKKFERKFEPDFDRGSRNRASGPRDVRGAAGRVQGLFEQVCSGLFPSTCRLLVPMPHISVQCMYSRLTVGSTTPVFAEQQAQYTTSYDTLTMTSNNDQRPQKHNDPTDSDLKNNQNTKHYQRTRTTTTNNSSNSNKRHGQTQDTTGNTSACSPTHSKQKQN